MDRLRILSGRGLVAWPWGDNALDTGDAELPACDAFRLEDERSYAPPPVVTHAEWPRMHVSLIVNDGFTTSYRAGLASRRFNIGRGSIFIYPAGFELATIRPIGGFRMLLVEVGGPLVHPLTQGRDSPTTADVEPLHNVRDPGLARLILALAHDLRHRRPAGRLHSEHLSLALASYVMGRYGIRHAADSVSSTLSGRQRARVREFIQANLACGISILELAAVAGLSPRHFTRLFRATFGASPHQYVRELRLDRARALLSDGSAAICDVALAAGFGSQSYFTDLFRRATGVTPRQYRLQNGSKPDR
ncbi:helix-turn-helix domain-containing protein [Salinisphaera orenii]|uniref:AraC family transcriptional regulator n=1 Tax=Salinisphaera orenii YIM 95161 TaxID=1051139 RepID=A0A423Q3X5_9GAMM|nr:helix-turn-helix domain-containing protein [Salinisphaera halophila]ROO33642.1 AraC family transcriptional regulator [Salinisphaera halophila YIM 95161]